ncbi:MAG: TatD family hydrolase [Granulosicoccaceae bacterium]
MAPQRNPELIDSHVHSDDPRLRDDFPAVMARARKAGVIGQIIPAVTREHWPRIKEYVAEHKDLYACYGLHPCFMAQHQPEDLQTLPLWLGKERPVAVGECGLDYSLADVNKSEQQTCFGAQLALAREFRLPIVVHAHRAVEDVIKLIKASGHNHGMVHSFNGSLQQAHRLMDLGFMMSFGGAVSYERAIKLREVFAALPLDSILLETDAPDQADAAHAKQRNEPAYLIDVWKALSELREETATKIAKATTENAKQLFAI